MPPKRFFIQTPYEKDGSYGEVYLTGDEFNHAKNVLRLGVGDEVTLLDGSGKEYSAVIAKAEKTRYLLHIVSACVSDREPQNEIYLLVGALKADKTELVVQKAVELGVSKIGVFSSKYCSAYMNENKLERLNRVSREAAKQCLRASAPEVVYFDDFQDALISANDYKCKLFACEFLKENGFPLEQSVAPAALVVGSEGGFSEEEFELARSLGFEGVTLGKRILRAETAAIAFLSVVAFALGELR